MKILYNTGTDFKESKESAENLAVKIIDDNGDVVEKTVQELVSDNFYGIERLIGTEDVNDDHRSIREIARNELAKQLIPEDARESLDTLREIADWIQDHPESASQMNSRIDTLEEAVPFVLYIQNGVYGYKKENGDFVPFKSQADIDAAVTAAKVGTATAADVLAGKTFTNSTTSGVTGTMVDHDAATNAVSVGTNNTNTYHRIPTGAYLKLQGTGYPEIVTPLTEYGDAAAGNVLSGKKFTSSAGLKATGTMPSKSLGTAATGSGIDSTGPYVYIPYGYWPEYSGKAGSSYTYMTAAQAVAACPKQEKSCTPSTSAQTVSPDSGKLLSKVTVNAVSLSGNAGTGDVRSGKTFYKDSLTKQTGTLADYSGSGHMITCQWGSGNGKRPAVRLASINPKTQIDGSNNGQKNYMEIAMPAGIWAWSWGNSSACIPYYTENCSATTSNQTVKASNWNSDAQNVSILDSVVVKPQSQTGTYACPSNWTGSPSAGGNGDMGATNNYRYVNASNVYNYGRARPNKYAGYFQVINPTTGSYESTGVGIEIPNATSISIKYKWELGAPKSGDTLTVIYTGDGWSKPTTYNLSGATGGTTTVNPPTKSGQYVCYVNFEVKNANRNGSSDNVKISYNITPNF